MKENCFICYSYLLKAKQSQPVRGRLEIYVSPLILLCLQYLVWERAGHQCRSVFSWLQSSAELALKSSPTFIHIPWQAKSDSQARWWQLGQGIVFSCKTSNFEHVIVANNPNSFLFNESTYHWQHQRCGVKGGWVKPGTDLLRTPTGWENETLEREDCLNTYINNRVKEVFIFSNRLWAKDFYPLFLFS